MTSSSFRRYLLAFGLALCSTAGALACEEQKVGLHLATRHQDRQAGYNEVNPGVYYVCDGYTVGTYRNSIRKQSVYAGYTAEYGPFALTAGLISGYYGKIQPFAIPSVKIPGTFVRVAYLPQNPESSGNTQGFHVMLEHSF